MPLIYPLSLDKQSLGLLQALLEQNMDSFIHSGRHTIAYQGCNREILLTHSLLRRPRERDSSQYRIEVLGQLLGKGGFGNVYTSVGVLEPENDFNFKRKPPGKERVIKEINLEKQSVRSICKEAHYTRYNEQLHCKSALFSPNNGYMVMRRASGEDLYTIINKLYDQKISLSAKHYLLLTLAILKAVKTQIHDKNLIHRDIKPENIMVDLEAMHVVMIDYSFAEKTKKKRSNHIKGTPQFMAPETLLKNKVTQRSDLYSLGLVLAELWGDTSQDDIEDFNDFPAILEDRKHFYFQNLFSYIDLPKAIRDGITSLLTGLTCYVESDRLGLDEAILHCTHLMNHLKQQDYPGQTPFISFFQKRSHSDGYLPEDSQFDDYKAGV